MTNSEITDVKFSPRVTKKQMENYANYVSIRTKFPEKKSNCLYIVEFVNHYLSITETELVHAMCYINKVASKFASKPYVNSDTLCALLIAALILAHKNLTDTDYDNGAISKFTGIDVKILNESEENLWKVLGYNCNISEKDYATFEKILNK